MIQDRIEAAVQWQSVIETEGQTPWEAKNSAAVKTEIREYKIITATVFVEAGYSDAELPIVHVWRQHGRGCMAYLVNAVPGTSSGTIRCQYRIEDQL